MLEPFTLEGPQGGIMTRAPALATVLGLAASLAPAQDPAKTDPGKYIVILENARTRVLEFRDHPGDRTHAHRHPDSVLYALSDFARRLTFPDGKSMTRTFKKGDVVFLEGQIHIGENIGASDTHVILVEFKEPPPSPPPSPRATPALP